MPVMMSKVTTKLTSCFLILVHLHAFALQASAGAELDCRQISVVKWFTALNGYESILRKPSLKMFEEKKDNCYEVCRDYIHALYYLPEYAPPLTEAVHHDSLLRAGYNLSRAQQAYLDNPDPCASLTPFSTGPSASICLHFWGWTENIGKVDQSCSCGALLQAVHLKKQMSDVDCSLKATQRRLEAFFNPFGFWVFPGASAEYATCPIAPDTEVDRDPGRCSTVGTWSWDDTCPRDESSSPLQRD